MGCFVNFGADWLGPGRILYGNRGAVVVGEIDGAPRSRTKDVFGLLKTFEPDAILTDNIWGYLWGKLAYGAMLFATALTPDSMSENFGDPRRRIVFETLGCEVMAVAAARDVDPIGFGDFDPKVFLPGAAKPGRDRVIDWLTAYTAQSAKTHSGIYRDLAVRKRRTEVDPQIGIIAKLGIEVGVVCPALVRLVALIHDIEDGTRPMAFETFQLLIDTCTSVSTAKPHS